MAHVPERLQSVHREALNARELPPRLAVATVTVVALALVLVTARDGLQAIDLGYILAPTILIGLMLFLAHRLGIAYAVIRQLDGDGRSDEDGPRNSTAV